MSQRRLRRESLGLSGGGASEGTGEFIAPMEARRRRGARMRMNGYSGGPRPFRATCGQSHLPMKLLLPCCLFCFLLSSSLAQESLFAPGRTGLDSGPEGNHYELGTVFRATVSGKVTHVRVYALASETGTHTARLWRNSDNALIGGPWTWTYGGAAGWTTLDIPDVLIAPDIDYTVAVSTGGAGRNYPFRSQDLPT